MEMCRACLSSTGDLREFDKASIENYNLLTNIMVSKSDGLPQSMCSTCKDAVFFFATFRSKCIETETSLKQILAQQKIKNEKITEQPQKVKVEAEFFEPENYLEVDFFEDACEFDNINNKVKIEPECVLNDLKRKTRTKKKEPKPKLKKEKKKQEKIIKSVAKKTIKTDAVVSKRERGRKLDFYLCGLCPKKFKRKATLSDHLEGHLLSAKPAGAAGPGSPGASAGLVCLTCGVKFNAWESLLSHRYYHLTEDQMMCHLCERRFCNAVTQENHYLRDHSGKSLGLACAWCETTCASRRKLNKHMLVHADRQFVCADCGKAFKSKSHLATHIGMHAGIKKYVCHPCDKKFTYHNGLLLHNRKYHMVGHYCRICTKVFQEEKLLEEHECRKTVICSVCGKVLQHMALLKGHMRTHNNDRPFKCDICSASYKSRSALTVHKNRHIGKRPYNCKHCSARFYSHSVLIKHTRIHTGEKPYVCKTCGKAFTGGHNLKVHMRVHGEELVVSRRAAAAAAPPRRNPALVLVS